MTSHAGVRSVRGLRLVGGSQVEDRERPSPGRYGTTTATRASLSRARRSKRRQFWLLRTAPLAALGVLLALGADLSPLDGQLTTRATGMTSEVDSGPDAMQSGRGGVSSDIAQRGMLRDGALPLAPWLVLPELITTLTDLAAMPDSNTVQIGTVDPKDVLASGFIRPVNGTPSSPFGLRLHPITGQWKLHSGLDLAAPCGTPVVAVADGVANAAGFVPSYGGRVVLKHPSGLTTTYNHLSAYAVTPGMSVKQGQVIGLVGTTGMSTGCHLHFEVVGPTGFLDPAPYLAFAPAPASQIPPAITPITTTATTPTATSAPTTALPDVSTSPPVPTVEPTTQAPPPSPTTAVAPTTSVSTAPPTSTTTVPTGTTTAPSTSAGSQQTPSSQASAANPS